MITIRRNVFETNSSSTHAVAILPKEAYEKLKADHDLWYHPKFGVCTTEEVKQHLPECATEYELEAYNENKDDEDFDFKQFMYEWSIGDWYWIEKYEDNECYYEEDIHEYTTKSGDEIVVVCNYGHDG